METLKFKKNNIVKIIGRSIHFHSIGSKGTIISFRHYGEAVEVKDGSIIQIVPVTDIIKCSDNCKNCKNRYWCITHGG